MTHRLVLADGSYQPLGLTSGDKTWLYLVLAVGIVGIIAGLILARSVLAADQGSPKMREIAKAIQEGAEAFLRRQFRTILFIVGPLAVLIFFTATKVVYNGHQEMSFAANGLWRVVCFLVGATFSGTVGLIGMSTAVRGNVRTAAAAANGTDTASRTAAALRVAFRTGAVTGLLCVGLGLVGASGIFLIFTNSATSVLVGFAFGASLLALFMRVGGGIFTKAADVGADLVGKVEVGIPEDDPRNAATIADNVGDNVGDCAGMAADLFESYVITMISALILGFAAFHQAVYVIFPLIIPAVGVLASIAGAYAVRSRKSDANALTAINRGFWLSSVLTIIAAFFVGHYFVHDNKVFYAVLTGVALSVVASQITEQFTSTERSPVREIAESARTGPATTVLSGLSIGLESSVWAILAIAAALAVGIILGDHNIVHTLFYVSLIGTGLLSTAGMIVSEDSFGPVSDNSAGVAEMAHEFEGETQRILVSLDAVGNTTKAITKGVAIGSAVIASVALFASFIETAGNQLNYKTAADAFKNIQINVVQPKIFIGLLIGGSIAFLFSALAIRAVGRTAGTVVQEVRRQFREHPGIMDYSEKPEYGRVIAICTTAAQRELATPALLAILSPVIVGFGLGYEALGGFLAAAILTGQLMANFLSNAGGAWDNAKKYIEDGHEGGKGSEAHKAAVIGDTVGDPFKDTAGPALNPLIKVMNLVSLLVLPAIITQEHHTAARYSIAGVALVILGTAVLFSKRSTGSMADAPTPQGAPTT